MISSKMLRAFIQCKIEAMQFRLLQTCTHQSLINTLIEQCICSTSQWLTNTVNNQMIFKYEKVARTQFKTLFEVASHAERSIWQNRLARG